MTAQQAHREDVARRVVIDSFLASVISHGVYFEKQFYDCYTPRRTMRHFLVHTADELDVLDLKELLELSGDDVIDWINSLPEVVSFMDVHQLALVPVLRPPNTDELRFLHFVLKESGDL